MQVLKEAVRKRINESAIKEFLAHGFEKASMRAIACGAGITVGNVYHYYKNKEDIFCSITVKVFEYVQDISDRHKQPIMGKDLKPGESLRELIGQYGALLESHNREFIILIERSKGTQFADARTLLIEILTTFLKKVVALYNENGIQMEIPTPFLLHLIAMNIVDTLVVVSKEYKDRAWAEEVLEKLVRYLLFGFSRFISNEGL